MEMASVFGLISDRYNVPVTYFALCSVRVSGDLSYAPLDAGPVEPGTMIGARQTRRVKEILRWEGAAGLASQLLAAAGYRPLGFFACPTRADEDPPQCAHKPEIAQLGPDDLEDYLAFRRGATADQFLGRLEAGHVGFAARVDGQLASVSWIDLEAMWTEYNAIPLRLKPGEIHMYDSFTALSFRGKRVSPQVFHRIRGHFEAAGYDRVVILIRMQNRPSVRNGERSGFRLTGRVGCFRLGAFAWYTASGDAAGRLPGDHRWWLPKRFQLPEPGKSTG